MFNINFLKANNGDAIHISYNFKDKPINIVIDSGSKENYTREEKEQRPPRKTIIIDGEFKNLIKTLKDKKEVINLLVITHVDNNYISGIKAYMESREFDSSMIKKVWFNSSQLINENFDSVHYIYRLFALFNCGVYSGIIESKKGKRCHIKY